MSKRKLQKRVNEVEREVPSKAKKSTLSNIESLDLGTKEWEDSIMFPLKVMKICLIVYLVLAIMLPIYKGNGLFIDSFSTVIVIALLCIGLADCYGKGFDVTPLFSTTFVRVSHFLINFFFMKNPINYIFYVLLIIFEISLSLLILMDKSKYECIKEREI